MNDVCAAVTQRIVAALEAGTVPWKKPWHSVPGAPENAVTRRPYRGLNVVLLSVPDYADNRWLTFRQARELGGSVRKGERSTEVAFWKPVERTSGTGGDAEEEEARARRYPLLRTYHVFNVQQCEGLRLPVRPDGPYDRANGRISRAENVARYMPDPPSIREGGANAWYRPSDDLVGLPPIGKFRTPDAYYATLFHELGHSTGHVKRLARPGVTGSAAFGSDDYSREELVAELASAFLCCLAGLDNSLADDSASYIAGWLKVLKGDPKAVIVASGQAQRASEWVLGRTAGLAEHPLPALP